MASNCRLRQLPLSACCSCRSPQPERLTASSAVLEMASCASSIEIAISSPPTPAASQGASVSSRTRVAARSPADEIPERSSGPSSGSSSVTFSTVDSPSALALSTVSVTCGEGGAMVSPCMQY